MLYVYYFTDLPGKQASCIFIVSSQLNHNEEAESICFSILATIRLKQHKMH